MALPLLIAALSVTRPDPLPPPALPPTFDGAAATADAAELSRLYPDRSPGSAGSLGAARWVAERLASYGYRSRVLSFSATIPGRGRVRLRNLIAVAPGRSREAIVVMAHRDDSGFGPGADDNASGTAALIELARGFATPATIPGRAAAPQHTIVFASVDGGAFGSLGAARFATDPEYAGRVVAVVNLDSIGAPLRPRLELAADTARSPAAALVATAAQRLDEQTGAAPRRTSALGQLLDLGFPLSLYGQAPLIAHGIPALTITTAGVRPPPSFGDTAERLDEKTVTEIGRAAQATVGSLDEGLELGRSAGSYLYLGARIVRGWALELVLLAMLVPYVVAVVDLFARCRRRRIALAPALRSYRSRLAIWLAAVVLFELFRLAGAWPSGAARPLDPETRAAGDWPVTWLVLLGILALLAWLVGRSRIVPTRPASAEEELAGHTAALLALTVIALLVAAVNPFALVFLLPSLHVWLWLPHTGVRGLGAQLGLLALGLVGPLLVVLSFAVRFGLGFDAPWYLAELVAIGYVPIVGLFLGASFLAATAQLTALALGRYAAYPPAAERPPRGPLRNAVRAVVLARRARRSATAQRRALGG